MKFPRVYACITTYRLSARGIVSFSAFVAATAAWASAAKVFLPAELGAVLAGLECQNIDMSWWCSGNKCNECCYDKSK